MERKEKGVCIQLLFLFALALLSTMALAQNAVIKVAYLEQAMPTSAALSNLDPPLTDEASQGARLAINDNNTTGKFTGHQFQLEEHIVPVGSSPEAVLRSLIDEGFEYIIVKSTSETLRKLSIIATEKGVLLFNVAAEEDELRSQFCSKNTFHIIPSYAMRADSLAQFMLKKRWKKSLLVKGAAQQDELFAKALERAAKRYAINISEQKIWSFEHDARRTAQAEIPVFTRTEDYDILLVADVAGLFGEYLSFNTWLARPVAGTQGLVPRAWHKTHERWGATQLQRRFQKQAKRAMTSTDYAAWLAVRAVGEAITRSGSHKVTDIRAFMLSDEFSLAGFKGTKLSFRQWNQQLRQPVLLSTARSMVAVMPLREILHPRTYLDTLGFDEKQSSCHLN